VSGKIAFLFALSLCLHGADDRVRLDNEFVRVIRAEVQPHVKGTLHRHEFNRVMIALDAGILATYYEDGRKETQHWKAGEATWSPAAGMHTSENTGERAFRLVEVEIKKPAPNASLSRNPALDPVKIDPRHNILLFENPQVRVFRSWREAGASEKMHEHTGAGRLTVLLTAADGEVKLADGSVTPLHAAAGDAMWSGPVTHATKNSGPLRFEMIVIEMK
jgi:hypothetical protein